MSATASISDALHDTTAVKPAKTKSIGRGQTDPQLLARLTGLLFLITYATSIPPYVALYVPALNDPAFILGGGIDLGLSWGALLEMLLIIANIGSAVALYPVLKRQNEALSLGFIGARITESIFIAVGILSVLALASLRVQGTGVENESMLAVGQALVAIHDLTFLLGPGFIVGIGNGLILGYLLWTSRLVPRAMAILGLIGGPALVAAAIAIIFGVIEQGSSWQLLATMPEFFWELSLGLWLLVKGFNPTALAALYEVAPESGAVNGVGKA
jgi:hypothetical protein